MKIQKDWKSSKAEVFWGEIAPCDHVVQIYENDAVFMDALAGFVGGGINAGDCCVIIATPAHLEALEKKLSSYGIQVDDLVSERRYFPINAKELLSSFMVNDWPDEKLFEKAVDGLLSSCQLNGRRIRAFGEMVALLWAEGHSGATVQLEHLWNQYCKKQSFCLFCAYPKSGFTGDIHESVEHICCAHSKMISGTEHQLTNIVYHDMKPGSQAVYL